MSTGAAVLRPAAERTADGESIGPVYVWDAVVRVTHWLIVLSILVLSVTGFYIGWPFIIASGQASEHFVMGKMKFIHFIAAIVFTLAVLSRVLWMFISPSRFARWKQFIPVQARRRHGLKGTLRFYLFMRDEPPGFAGHNPLAGMTYVLVFVLYFVMITTGLGVWALSAHYDSPFRFFAFLAWVWGGPQTARWIHHIGMWLLLGFAVHHVYSAWLVSVIEENGTLGSIVSGFKFLQRSVARAGEKDK